MAAPSKLALYVDIDFSARNSVLNAVATMVDNWNTYWSSTTPKAKILDPSAGEIMSHRVGDLNLIINCVNAMNTEFGLGVTNTPVILSMDYTNFQVSVNKIITQMIAMQAAKP